MSVLGIDYNTRQVDCVLLDDETGAAEYLPIPFSTRKKSEAFRFDEARDVEHAVRTALCRKSWALPDPPMQTVHLIGIEKPIGRNPDNQWKYGLVCAGILAAIPRQLTVLELPPNYGAHSQLPGWKALCDLPTNASKTAVREWATVELLTAGSWAGFADAPQDAFDSYCLARAAQRLNERARAA